MWLGHAWVDGRRTDADLTAFARRLKTTGIRDLYVHTGPMEHDGTLPEELYPKARWLIDGMHRELPGVRVQAFLGDVLATEGPDGMRLEKAATRAAAVRGVRLGLSRTDAGRERFGVAAYIDFAATEEDRTAYREDWVR
ncbi:hypothetical protein [Streptomyces sp. NPDC006384]|uniref:hypothetical protein n=1 Tax=Streptomyces sp. NPDC006384 TaxID=3364745 RepID=UPI0036A15921